MSLCRRILWSSSGRRLKPRSAESYREDVRCETPGRAIADLIAHPFAPLNYDEKGVRSPTMHRPILRYAWASPATVAGLCIALVALAGGATVHRVDGVLEVAGGSIGRGVSRLGPRFGFCAITLGHVILGTDHRVLAQCRAHEQVHVRQYERWGLVFLPLYAASSLWQAVRGGRPYQDNHFERQAREESSPAAVKEGATP